MLKTFTLHAISHQQQTAEKGLITWEMLDEQNNIRQVKGITSLSQQGFIKNVESIHRREMPLVEILSQRGEGDTFVIDFSLFNQTFGYPARDVFPPPSPSTPPAGNRLKNGLKMLFRLPFRR
ncbi:hypothetical protein [Candidatus Thiothrix anitrata]|uniref:Uncharacterized protein n=1 Tax=Candidatus Thiothrix anitrata TaxID=2823902 RepID=A0ABX7X2C4_9GAMM|nr:hypothetical protein [Candidatus Thiothrix anitrata]QTR49542.1 hypothetical protein J8380_15085 [Candidatus Thiothrix anitrata]